MNFFQIHVPMWQWWLSQAIGAFALIFVFLQFQAKTKQGQLSINAFVNILLIISSALILNFVITAIMAVAFLKNIVFAKLAKKEQPKAWHKHTAFCIFVFLKIVAVAFTWWLEPDLWTWFNLAVLFTAIYVTYMKAYKNINWLKGGSFLNNSVKLVNAAMFFDISGLLKSSMTLKSIIIFYYRKRKANKEQPESIDDSE
ncbi:MAG: YgjV family protein [Firmicutes bacterium]|nr:YgjV family protein [Bacillota bacterium]